MSSAWKPYVRHAERFGAEAVYETAEEAGENAETLSAIAMKVTGLELWPGGTLDSSHRRVRSPKWALSQAERERLAVRLIAAGVQQPRRLARMLVCGERHARTLLDRAAEGSEAAL